MAKWRNGLGSNGKNRNAGTAIGGDDSGSWTGGCLRASNAELKAADDMKRRMNLLKRAIICAWVGLGCIFLLNFVTLIFVDSIWWPWAQIPIIHLRILLGRIPAGPFGLGFVAMGLALLPLLMQRASAIVKIGVLCVWIGASCLLYSKVRPAGGLAVGLWLIASSLPLLALGGEFYKVLAIGMVLLGMSLTRLYFMRSALLYPQEMRWRLIEARNLESAIEQRQNARGQPPPSAGQGANLP
jgi:hypothetical protein